MSTRHLACSRSTFSALSHLLHPHTSPVGWWLFHCIHFAEEATKAKRGQVARPGPRGRQRLLGDASPGCLAPEATAVGTGAVQCALDVVSLTLVLQLLLSPQG